MKKIPNKIKKSAPATFKEIPKNQKVKTGVSGLDTILRSGYTKGHVSLIRGSSGTGKSMF